MKYFKKIVGKKVYLSPMNSEDVEIYTKWMNDFDVTDGLGNSYMMTSLKTETNWLNDSNGYQFAIIKKDNDELLGNCSLFNLNQIHQIGMIGIFIGEEENRHKGYGTEAIKLLIEYGFNYLNLHNIMLNVYSFNQNAINCYKKIGFKECGRRRECYYLGNKLYDEISMDFLKIEYQKEGVTNV